MRSLRRRFSLDMPRRSREPVTGHGRGSGASGPEAPYRDDLPASTGPRRPAYLVPGREYAFTTADCWRGCRPWLWTGPNCRIRDCAHGGRESAPGNGVQPVRIDVISRATAINNFVDIGPTASSTGDLYV